MNLPTRWCNHWSAQQREPRTKSIDVRAHCFTVNHWNVFLTTSRGVSLAIWKKYRQRLFMIPWEVSCFRCQHMEVITFVGSLWEMHRVISPCGICTHQFQAECASVRWGIMHRTVTLSVSHSRVSIVPQQVLHTPGKHTREERNVSNRHWGLFETIYFNLGYAKKIIYNNKFSKEVKV